MKYLHLVWAGIWRRPGRATLTLLSIVNAFLLYGLLQGLISGLGSTVAATHADVLITASKISQLEPLPMSQLPQIRATPGVRSATPLIIFHGAYHTAQPVNFRGFAIDPDSFVATNQDETIPQADIDALKRNRAGAILPATLAATFNLKVGDKMPVKTLLWSTKDGPSWPLSVVGVYKGNPKDVFFGSALLTNFDYVDQARTQSTGTSSIFLVRVDRSCAGQPDRAAHRRPVRQLAERDQDRERAAAGGRTRSSRSATSAWWCAPSSARCSSRCCSRSAR